MDRLRRLANALRNETAKRLPYILLIFLLLSLIGGFKSYRKISEGVQIAKDNSISNQVLLQKIADLSEDNKKLLAQNKELSTQNYRLAQQNAKHINCIAELAAKYTRDQQPTLSVDLDTCNIASLTAILSTPGLSDFDSEAPASTVAAPPATSATPPPPTAPVATSPPPPNPQLQPPSILDRLVDGTLKSINDFLRGL